MFSELIEYELSKQLTKLNFKMTHSENFIGHTDRCF